MRKILDRARRKRTEKEKKEIVWRRKSDDRRTDSTISLEGVE